MFVIFITLSATPVFISVYSSLISVRAANILIGFLEETCRRLNFVVLRVPSLLIKRYLLQ